MEENKVFEYAHTLPVGQAIGLVMESCNVDNKDYKICLNNRITKMFHKYVPKAVVVEDAYDANIFKNISRQIQNVNEELSYLESKSGTKGLYPIIKNIVIKNVYKPSDFMECMESVSKILLHPHLSSVDKNFVCDNIVPQKLKDHFMSNEIMKVFPEYITENCRILELWDDVVEKYRIGDEDANLICENVMELFSFSKESRNNFMTYLNTLPSNEVNKVVHESKENLMEINTTNIKPNQKASKETINGITSLFENREGKTSTHFSSQIIEGVIPAILDSKMFDSIFIENVKGNQYYIAREYNGDEIILTTYLEDGHICMKKDWPLMYKFIPKDNIFEEINMPPYTEYMEKVLDVFGGSNK